MVNILFVVALMGANGESTTVQNPSPILRNQLLNQSMTQSQYLSIRAKYLALKEEIEEQYPNASEQEINEKLTEEVFGQYDALNSDIVLNGGTVIEPSYSYYPRGLNRDEFWYIFWNLSPWQWGTVGDVKEVTETKTIEIYGVNGNGDNSDAFRHVYLSALLALEFGENFSNGLMSRHESYTGSDPVELLRVEMDEHNNPIGASIGGAFDNGGNLHDTDDGNDYEDLAEKVANAVKHGAYYNIKRLNSANTALTYTNVGINSSYYPPYC